MTFDELPIGSKFKLRSRQDTWYCKIDATHADWWVFVKDGRRSLAYKEIAGATEVFPVKERKPLLAEVFPLGEFLREELQARGWSVEQLAGKAVLSVECLTRLLEDPGTFLLFWEAEHLAMALGVSPALLLNIQLQWCKAQETK